MKTEKTEKELEQEQADLVSKAETIVEPSTRGREFSSRSEIKSFLTKVLNEKWFKKKYPWIDSFRLRDARDDNKAFGWRKRRRCYLIVPPWARYEMAVLHLLANGITLDSGGPEFCETFLHLLGRIVDKEAEQDLRKWFRKLGVKYHPPREVEPQCDGVGLPVI